MIFENEPLLGITADGRPMTRARVDEILGDSQDFKAVESPAIAVDVPPPAVIEVREDAVVVCAWHDGGRGKRAADQWASLRGKPVTHGSCPTCSAAVKAGTWVRLT